MRSLLKSAANRLFPAATLHARAYNMLIRDRSSYLHATGWIASLSRFVPVDSRGHELPWMNYPVVRLLEDRLRSDFELFEYGSGYSTGFYARLVRSVTSVEHEESWYREMGRRVPENVKLIFQREDSDGNYCRSIAETRRRYDVVIVDGRDRVNCIVQSIPCLTDRGIIVLDDAERAYYKEGISLLHRAGFRKLIFEGLKATSGKLETAAVFYRDGNCLGI
jgi:hypothetical protein